MPNSEHFLIQKYFAPLAKNFSGSLNLNDDAAILSIPQGFDLVVTKDAISENIHYLECTDPALIAKKLLRTNLSDLAGKGAEPLCYFLSIALPAPLSEEFIARFAEGLAEDQREFSIHLAGGDTITTKGSATFSLTAHGLVPKGRALLRTGAQPGDDIYVTGTLGDAALGLQLCHPERSRGISLEIPPLASLSRNDNFLIGRYHLPQPRLQEGIALRTMATSGMDISDGLIADLTHLCNASATGAEIDQEKLPLSKEAKKEVEASPILWPLIYSGGDDYELLFTLPAGKTPPIHATKIGKMVEGKGVKLLLKGKEIPVLKTGYSH